jgi:hypothetical protein
MFWPTCGPATAPFFSPSLCLYDRRGPPASPRLLRGTHVHSRVSVAPPVAGIACLSPSHAWSRPLLSPALETASATSSSPSPLTLSISELTAAINDEVMATATNGRPTTSSPASLPLPLFSLIGTGSSPSLPYLSSLSLLMFSSLLALAVLRPRRNKPPRACLAGAPPFAALPAGPSMSPVAPLAATARPSLLAELEEDDFAPCVVSSKVEEDDFAF